MATKKAVTKKSLPKAQIGKQVSGMYDFQNIYTGPNNANPGILKAKVNKTKATANIAQIKKKSDAQKATAISNAKTKK